MLSFMFGFQHSFTNATCQIWLSFFKLERNRRKAFFDPERLQIWETSQNLPHPFT